MSAVVCVCVCVCVCVRVCVLVCLCVCVRERERGGTSVCVVLYVRDCAYVYVWRRSRVEVTRKVIEGVA